MHELLFFYSNERNERKKEEEEKRGIIDKIKLNHLSFNFLEIERRGKIIIR